MYYKNGKININNVLLENNLSDREFLTIKQFITSFNLYQSANKFALFSSLFCFIITFSILIYERNTSSLYGDFVLFLSCYYCYYSYIVFKYRVSGKRLIKITDMFKLRLQQMIDILILTSIVGVISKYLVGVLHATSLPYS